MKLNGVDIDPFYGSLELLLLARSIRHHGVAVAIDGEVIPRSEWTTTLLNPNCEIEIVTAAAGG